MKRNHPLAFLATLVVLSALALGSCATGPNPCIGPAAARPTMPCTCPGSTNEACYPFPSDAKKPTVKKTCYRMTMGCTPDATGKCIAAPLDEPREIPCNDTPDGGPR